MDLYVYRLRMKGNRRPLDAIGGLTNIGRLGNLRYFRAPFSHFGQDTYRAELLDENGKDLLPYLAHARICKVESGLLIAGIETVYASVKDQGTRHRQSWYCVKERVKVDSFASYEDDEVPF